MDGKYIQNPRPKFRLKKMKAGTIRRFAQSFYGRGHSANCEASKSLVKVRRKEFRVRHTVTIYGIRVISETRNKYSIGPPSYVGWEYLLCLVH